MRCGVCWPWPVEVAGSPTAGGSANSCAGFCSPLWPDRIARLLQDVLDVSRIEDGRVVCFVRDIGMGAGGHLPGGVL